MKAETIDEARIASKKLVEMGSRIGLITMGEQGAVFTEENGRTEHVRIDRITKVCDSTGAGDSFVGTLAFLLAQRTNMDLAERVSRACRVASQSVEKKGTQTSYPAVNDLDFSLFD